MIAASVATHRDAVARRDNNSTIVDADKKQIWLIGDAHRPNGSAGAKRANHPVPQILIGLRRHRLTKTREGKAQHEQGQYLV